MKWRQHQGKKAGEFVYIKENVLSSFSVYDTTLRVSIGLGSPALSPGDTAVHYALSIKIESTWRPMSDIQCCSMPECENLFDDFREIPKRTKKKQNQQQ